MTVIFLKCLLDKDNNAYIEQLNYITENNWANYIQDERHTYNLPLVDDNHRQMKLEQ